MSKKDKAKVHNKVDVIIVLASFYWEYYLKISALFWSFTYGVHFEDYCINQTWFENF